MFYLLKIGWLSFRTGRAGLSTHWEQPHAKIYLLQHLRKQPIASRFHATDRRPRESLGTRCESVRQCRATSVVHRTDSTPRAERSALLQWILHRSGGTGPASPTEARNVD